MPKKVVLLGDFGVGKTSFGLRLSEDRFEETTIATLGVAHFTCKVAGLTPFSAATKLEVWDTAGQERYRSLDSLRLYLRRALGAIVVVDVTSAGSLEAAKRVVSQLRLDEARCRNNIGPRLTRCRPPPAPSRSSTSSRR